MEFPVFPTSPSSDEVLVDQGDVFKRGNGVMIERLKQSSGDTGMPFEIESLQVSYSAQYPLIVRAYVRWTIEGQIVRSREMLRIDGTGSQHSDGEVFG